MGHDCLKTDLKKSKNYPVEAKTPLIPLSHFILQRCHGGHDVSNGVRRSSGDMYNLLTRIQAQVIPTRFIGLNHSSIKYL